jgi:hypothetical protein
MLTVIVQHSFSVRRMCPGRPIQLTRGDPVPTIWHLGPRCVVPISLPRRLSLVHPVLTEILLQIPQSSLGFLAGGGARVSFSALRRSMWGRALRLDGAVCSRRKIRVEQRPAR